MSSIIFISLLTKSHTGGELKIRWAIFFIFFILMLLPSFSFAQEEWGGPLSSLSEKERVELTFMVHPVWFSVTQAKHKRFWEIADSHKWSEADVQEAFDRLLGNSDVRKRYMIRAVLGAYGKKKDAKSAEFQEYEVKLLKMGLLTPEKIKESNEFIYKVAHGKPGVFTGLWGEPWAETPFNDTWADNYRANLEILDRHYERLLLLFDRNWKGE